MKIDKIKIISDHVEKKRDTVSYYPIYTNRLKCIRGYRCISKEQFLIVIKKSKAKIISPLDNLETIKNLSIVNFGYTTKKLMSLWRGKVLCSIFSLSMR